MHGYNNIDFLFSKYQDMSIPIKYALPYDCSEVVDRDLTQIIPIKLKISFYYMFMGRISIKGTHPRLCDME